MWVCVCGGCVGVGVGVGVGVCGVGVGVCGVGWGWGWGWRGGGGGGGGDGGVGVGVGGCMVDPSGPRPVGERISMPTNRSTTMILILSRQGPKVIFRSEGQRRLPPSVCLYLTQVTCASPRNFWITVISSSFLSPILIVRQPRVSRCSRRYFICFVCFFWKVHQAGGVHNVMHTFWSYR